MMNGYEFLQFIGLDASSENRYDEFESYVEIDPITGKLLRGAKRFQYNYRVEKNSLTTDVLSCTPPTDSYSILGYGCVIYHVRRITIKALILSRVYPLISLFYRLYFYAPLYFQPAFYIDESNVMDYAESSRLQYSWFDIPTYMFFATVISGALGGCMLCISQKVIKTANKAEITFKQRIYID